jgi:hypothetical protein
MLGEYDATANAIDAVWVPFGGPSSAGANIVAIAIGPDGNVWGLDQQGYLDVYVTK